MSVRISYVSADGNTVPYPPLVDDIRQNHGFIDTRGRPDRIAEIPEARQSAALAKLLRALAAPHAPLVSLGCDLGQHEETKARLETRRIAGGYVQVISGARREPADELDYLREVGKTIERTLSAVSGKDRWNLRLQLSPVLLRFDEDRDQNSVWIWFFAKASTFERAAASRERLLLALERMIGELTAR